MYFSDQLNTRNWRNILLQIASFHLWLCSSLQTVYCLGTEMLASIKIYCKCKDDAERRDDGMLRRNTKR